MHKKYANIILLCALACLMLCACGGKSVQPAPADPTPAPQQPTFAREYSIEISELMAKNRAVVRDENGEFSDWVELHNYSEKPQSLDGLYLTDRESAEGWQLPAVTLEGDEYLLIFCDGKGSIGEYLHSSFTISQNETVYLKNSYGDTISSMTAVTAAADTSVTAEGECRLPSPGAENTRASYEKLLAAQESRTDIQINEVCVSSFVYYKDLADEDWIEFKNISENEVRLSDWYISDDNTDLTKSRLPDIALAAGRLVCVPASAFGFELDSENEQLYLSDSEGQLSDYVSLHDIPYRGSYGRLDGGTGWYYFTKVTPGTENADGKRYISQMPQTLTPDGIYEGEDGVSVKLRAEGTIYYTLDGSLPDENSAVYTEPLELTETAVVRAVSIERASAPSRALTLTYIINEGFTLPVASLVTDSPKDYDYVCSRGIKSEELPGNIAYYDENGSFSIGCGMKLNGETSLVLPKKNMSLRFRGAYGSSTLNYDIFGGGATEFQNLLLRSGQDYYSTVIRNELCQELALEFSDKIFSQRSRFCILYINGEYAGLYTVKEKSNEALYASRTGTSVKSATALEANVWQNTELYADVFGFARNNDLAKQENYAALCEKLDIDSLIDWIIMEGFTGNNDLLSGNLRYCRSTEDDGKWRLMFYDLDATFSNTELAFTNVLSSYRIDTQQISALVGQLLRNEEFTDRLLTRTAEGFNTVLTNKHVMDLAQKMMDEIAPEIPRDFEHYHRDLSSWYNAPKELNRIIVEQDWQKQCINNLKGVLNLTDAQIRHYFG